MESSKTIIEPEKIAEDPWELKKFVEQKSDTKQCWWLAVLEVARCSHKLKPLFAENGLLFQYYKKKVVPAPGALPEIVEKNTGLSGYLLAAKTIKDNFKFVTTTRQTWDTRKMKLLVYGPVWQRMIMHFLQDTRESPPWNMPTCTVNTSDRVGHLKDLLERLGLDKDITFGTSCIIAPDNVEKRVNELRDHQFVLVDKKVEVGGHCMAGIVQRVQRVQHEGRSSEQEQQQSASDKLLSANLPMMTDKREEQVTKKAYEHLPPVNRPTVMLKVLKKEEPSMTGKKVDNRLTVEKPDRLVAVKKTDNKPTPTKPSVETTKKQEKPTTDKNVGNKPAPTKSSVEMTKKQEKPTTDKNVGNKPTPAKLSIEAISKPDQSAANQSAANTKLPSIYPPAVSATKQEGSMTGKTILSVKQLAGPTAEQKQAATKKTSVESTRGKTTITNQKQPIVTENPKLVPKKDFYNKIHVYNQSTSERGRQFFSCRVVNGALIGRIPTKASLKVAKDARQALLKEENAPAQISEKEKEVVISWFVPIEISNGKEKL